MNKINYQKELDRVIEKITGEGKVPKLLLHVCCAPCSSYCLEYLSKYFDITVYFYNPNISIADEYNYRLSEEKRLVSLMPFEHPVKVIEGEYLPKDYFEYVKGLENEPEGGKRCEKCFRLRLESSARYAKEHGFDYFTTTLTISPLKNAQLLNSIGAELGEKYGIPWLYSDFKKREGYTPEELAQIVERSAGILGIKIEHDGALEIASRSRGTPRIANRLLKRVRDFAQVMSNGVITLETARTALDRLEIDELGLDRNDRRMLEAIVRFYNGGPVGLETLAAAIGEEAVTIEDVYEPYLLQIGFVSRTPRGRCITAEACRHLGCEFPKGVVNAQPTLFGDRES